MLRLARRLATRLISPKSSNISSPIAQTPDPGSGVELVTTLERLDEKLAEIDAAWSISDDAARSVFASFQMSIPVEDVSNPWSDAYRQGQFELYHRLSSRAEYTTNNEISGFAVDPKRPFPYYTESSATVGDQLLAIGYIIKTLGLPAGASILEFGPGWGNTTIALSRMGYDVTALDIDPNFVQLINDRADAFSLKPQVRIGAFLDAATIDQTFDAVLFYECFHHCSDHIQLLQDLHRVVKPGGFVALAAEPILEGFHAPWGLRLDGESLWAIRQNGWLELGFTESYFIETAMRQGWSVTRHRSDVSALTSIFLLKPLGSVLYPGALRLPPSDESGWAAADSPTATQRYTTGASRLACPVNGNWGHVDIDLVNPSPFTLPFTIKHGLSALSGQILPNTTKRVRLQYDPSAGSIEFATKDWTPSHSIPGSQDGRVLGLGVACVAFTNE